MRWCVALSLVLANMITAGMATDTTPEAVKAGFIVNFARFTRWPASADATVSVCFPTTAEPVGALMTRRYDDVWIDDKPIEVLRGLDLDALRRCNIVYLGAHDAYRRGEILGALGDASVLTVGDLPGFKAAGGMIELFPEGNKYRFAVNLDALASKDLEINARVLGLARDPVRRP